MKFKCMRYAMMHVCTVCPESSDPFYIVTYYIKWVTTSWTYCTLSRKANFNLGNMSTIFGSVLLWLYWQIIYKEIQKTCTGINKILVKNL